MISKNGLTTISQIESSLTIEGLMVEHYHAVYSLALSILNDPDEADDATQEVFIAVNQNLEGFRYEADPKTWLCAITINKCRSLLRNRKFRDTMRRAYQALQSVVKKLEKPEELTLRNIADEEIWAVVDHLPDKHRMPILLRYGHNLAISEIAQVLGLREGTVHSRLHYARAKLRGQLLRRNRHAERD